MKKHTITKREMHLLTQMKKHKHDHRLHKIHKKHKISYKTLFYMKEYGPRSHIATVIVKESIKILLLASLISSLGGVHLKGIEDKFVTLVPLLILLPALNDMIGDFGTIAASKFTTMLFLGKVRGNWWESPDVRHMVKILFAVALISSVYIGALSYAMAYLRGFEFTWLLFGKVIENRRRDKLSYWKMSECSRWVGVPCWRDQQLHSHSHKPQATSH